MVNAGKKKRQPTPARVHYKINNYDKIVVRDMDDLTRSSAVGLPYIHTIRILFLDRKEIFDASGDLKFR